MQAVPTQQAPARHPARNARAVPSPAVFLLRALLLAGIATAPGDLAAQEKAPVPDAAAQEPVVKAARDIYGDRFARAKTDAEKGALARQILEAASKVPAGSVDHYVLLKIARDIATGAGDVLTALEAADRMAERFDVPGVQARGDVLLAGARRASSSAQHKAVAEAAVKVVADLAAAEEYDAAKKLCETARTSARRARQYALVKTLSALAERVGQQEQAARAYREALAVLAKQPGDPAANLAAGRYLCFVKGDWSRGVPMLALGSDAELKSLATRELKAAKSAEDQASLGDAWWALAEKKEGREKESLMLRAGTWYQQAQPGVAAGLARVKVEKRLDQIAKLGRDIPEPPGGPPLAIVPFDAKKAKALQSRWAKHLKAPAVQTNSIGMKLVLIPPGEFEMGSTKEEVARLLEEAKQENVPASYVERLPSEVPEHRVKITRPFYLGACEVTQAEYQRVTGSNPSQFQGDLNRPVERVGWDDAKEFCRKLSGLPQEKAARATYRLPSEAEWEYACRAGSATRRYFGDDPGQLGEYAWTGNGSGLIAHPVATKKPNAWGLFDMYGNCWEWCADWHAEDYYARSPAEGPRGPESGTARVLRGGSWWDRPVCTFRSASRGHANPSRRHSGGIGFRVVRSVAP